MLCNTCIFERFRDDRLSDATRFCGRDGHSVRHEDDWRHCDDEKIKWYQKRQIVKPEPQMSDYEWQQMIDRINSGGVSYGKQARDSTAFLCVKAFLPDRGRS